MGDYLDAMAQVVRRTMDESSMRRGNAAAAVIRDAAAYLRLMLPGYVEDGGDAMRRDMVDRGLIEGSPVPEPEVRGSSLGLQSNLGDDFATNESLFMDLGIGEADVNPLLDVEELLARQARREELGAGQTDMFGETVDDADAAFSDFIGDLDDDYDQEVAQFLARKQEEAREFAEGEYIFPTGPGAQGSAFVRLAQQTADETVEQTLVKAEDAKRLLEIEQATTSDEAFEAITRGDPARRARAIADTIEARSDVQQGTMATLRLAEVVHKASQGVLPLPTGNSTALRPPTNPYSWEDAIDVLQPWPYGETPKQLLVKYIGKQDLLKDTLEKARLDLQPLYRQMDSTPGNLSIEDTDEIMKLLSGEVQPLGQLSAAKSEYLGIVSRLINDMETDTRSFMHWVISEDLTDFLPYSPAEFIERMDSINKGGNYVPRIWADKPGPARSGGRRPGFTRERIYRTYTEAREAGEEPKYNDPFLQCSYGEVQPRTLSGGYGFDGWFEEPGLNQTTC